MSEKPIRTRLKIWRLKAELAWLKVKAIRPRIEAWWLDKQLAYLERKKRILESKEFMEEDE
jgi:hypothetical protein